MINVCLNVNLMYTLYKSKCLILNYALYNTLKKAQMHV